MAFLWKKGVEMFQENEKPITFASSKVQKA